MWSGHTSINHAALQQQAGRSIDFLIALGMEDISKKKAGPVYHCAAEIHLRGYCSQARSLTDVLIYIRSQMHPHLPSTSTRQRGTNTKLYPSSPGRSIPQVLMSCGSKLAKKTPWGRKLFFQELIKSSPKDALLPNKCIKPLRNRNRAGYIAQKLKDTWQRASRFPVFSQVPFKVLFNIKKMLMHSNSSMSIPTEGCPSSTAKFSHNALSFLSLSLVLFCFSKNPQSSMKERRHQVFSKTITSVSSTKATLPQIASVRGLYLTLFLPHALGRHQLTSPTPSSQLLWSLSLMS